MSAKLINVRGKTGFQYRCPTDSNDRKREGRYLKISTDEFSVKLNGTQLNTIKRILEEAGEI